MSSGAGRQFDDVAVGIAKVDRPDKAVVYRTADFPTFGLALPQHTLECVVLDPERDMQIQRVLVLEIERRARHLEEGEARAIIHFEESVKGTALIDLKCADQPETEKFLVEGPCLLRIPTPISVVVQTLDHVNLRSPRF